MSDWSEKSKSYIRQKWFLYSSATGVAFLFVSLVVNYFAAAYTTVRASNPVTDIVLSNIRVYDVDEVFIYGPLVLLLFVVFILIMQPRRIPFVLKAASLFIVIRAVFITLTHLGPFPTFVVVDQLHLMRLFTNGDDLFFSGHTGFPFLLGLIFWDEKYLRVLFFSVSALFGVVVLLGHLHYSIDVLAAFFITYSIFHIAQRFFRKDWKFSRDGLQNGRAAEAVSLNHA